jgi:hypothetical protein
MLLVWEDIDLMKCRVLAKQMRDEKWANIIRVTLILSMEGYEYPIQQMWDKKWVVTELLTRCWYTIDQIWDRCGNSDDGKALKDICLSFSLFQLLKRRYLGLACAEARNPKTRHFVLKKLLPSEQEYERAFRVVEVELGFC